MATCCLVTGSENAVVGCRLLISPEGICMALRNGQGLRRWGADFRCFLLLASVAVFTTTLCSSSYAQKGQNAVYNHAITPAPTNSPSFFDATQFDTGGDACQQIAATFNDSTFPSTGGTVDARGLAGNGSSPLTCSVNPIPAGAKGRLLLSAGTYLAQVPWVIQNNDLNVVGTGGGGGTNTIIQACAALQPNCGGVVFPSGQGIIQLGPTAAGNAISRVTVKELGVDCQDVPGVSGVQVIAAQEETVLDLVIATGCRVAGFDIGIGDPSFLGGTGVQNGAALSNFEVGYPPNGSGGGQGCPAVTAGSISGATRGSNGVVTATLSVAPNPPLVVGNEVVIAGFSNATFNGTYRVLSFSSPVFTYQTSTTGGTTLGNGLVSPYPVGVRVWQVSSSAVRPIINGTINGSNCASFPPIAMELSGGSPFVQNVHTEGFAVGVQIGDLSGTNGATLTNLKLNHNTTTGIVISNQWATAGGAPGALPTENINIFNLDVTGGPGTQTAQSIIDNVNGNTLTNPTGGGGNGAVGYYLFGLNGVTTSAKPESGLINAFDINGQMTAIYSGSSNAVFSAGPTAVSIGTGSNPSSLTINGGIANNGTGFQTKRMGSCTTANGPNSFCNTTVTWNTAFANTSYTHTCQLTAAGSNSWAVVHSVTASKMAGSAIIQITNGPAGGTASGTLECIAVHD